MDELREGDQRRYRHRLFQREPAVEGCGWQEERTKEGCPGVTAETEAIGDSRSTYERGPSLVGSLGSSCRYKRFLSYLGGFSRHSTKYSILLTVHYFTSFVRIVQQAGQTVVPRRLSLNMYLWIEHTPPPDDDVDVGLHIPHVFSRCCYIMMDPSTPGPQSRSITLLCIPKQSQWQNGVVP